MLLPKIALPPPARSKSKHPEQANSIMPLDHLLSYDNSIIHALIKSQPFGRVFL
jgi:hypothetical protein